MCIRDRVLVLEHTNYSLKNREESEYHTDDNLMKILTNHQLGNSAPKLSTQKSKPEEAKADKYTESSVDKSATWEKPEKPEWRDWGSSSWQSQSRDASSWTNKNWYDKNTSDSRNTNKKQKTAYEISLGLVGSEMCIRDSLPRC